MMYRYVKVALLLTWPLLCVACMCLINSYQTAKDSRPRDTLFRVEETPLADGPAPPSIDWTQAEVPSLPKPHDLLAAVDIPPPPIPPAGMVPDPTAPAPVAPLAVPPIATPKPAPHVVEPPPIPVRVVATPKPVPPAVEAPPAPIPVVAMPMPAPPAVDPPPAPVLAPILPTRPKEPLAVVSNVDPLPLLHLPPPQPTAQLPLTGKFRATLDDHRVLFLPAGLRDQLDVHDNILVSPGTEKCLWLFTTNRLDLLTDRLERSGTADVQAFRRLFFSQAENAALQMDGGMAISERMARFAGLQGEIIVIGADDHIELWNPTRWRQVHDQLRSQDED